MVQRDLCGARKVRLQAVKVECANITETEPLAEALERGPGDRHFSPVRGSEFSSGVRDQEIVSWILGSVLRDTFASKEFKTSVWPESSRHKPGACTAVH